MLISAYSLLFLSCCTLVPSNSTEKVRHPVLFLDRFKEVSEFMSLYKYDEEWQGPPAFYLNIKVDLDGRRLLKDILAQDLLLMRN